jgi:hypothetical protein
MEPSWTRVAVKQSARTFAWAAEFFGLVLSVEEIVIERVPPQRKVWETTGSPKLLVIGQYRMGFEITSQGNGSLLRVDIDYALPEDAPARSLGSLFGRFYARWCTRQMLADAAKHFAVPFGRWQWS